MAAPLYRFDFECRRGDDVTLAVKWDPDGVVIDLTGATAAMKVVWPAAGSITAGEVEFNTTDGDITISAAEKTVTVLMGAAETALIPFGSAPSYQLRVTTLDGVKTTIAAGTVTVLRSLLDA